MMVLTRVAWATVASVHWFIQVLQAKMWHSWFSFSIIYNRPQSQRCKTTIIIMRLRFYSLVALLLLTGCRESSDSEMIDSARSEIIKLNQKFNQLYHGAMYQYMKGDDSYASAVMVLQELTKETIAVNKSLKIDCRKYNDQGGVIMFQNEDGTSSPLEIIPDDLKIEE